MEAANKLMMVSTNVGDMSKTKAFYVGQLGFKVSTEYHQDDNNWWVTLEFPGGGATLTLSRASVSPQNIQAGTLSLYFETFDIAAAHEGLGGKELAVSGVQDDLFGPDSGVRWFNVKDPDGNAVFFVQQHDVRAPF